MIKKKNQKPVLVDSDLGRRGVGELGKMKSHGTGGQRVCSLFEADAFEP